MKFEKGVISIVFFFIFNNPLSSELQNQSYSLFFENPSFVFSLENQKVQIDGLNSQILNKNTYLIKNPVVVIRREDALLDIDSSKAMYFQDSQKIEFLDSVNFCIFNDENSLNIKAEELIVEIEKATISSEKEAETIFDDIKVNSIGMNLIYVPDGYNADFAQAAIKIMNKESVHKGFANKISMISKENELIMEGNAYLNRNGFEVSADLIHYNFKSNKIIRSINSTIQSDS
jgi:lipopolysaccharide export system protein LptA